MIAPKIGERGKSGQLGGKKKTMMVTGPHRRRGSGVPTRSSKGKVIGIGPESTVRLSGSLVVIEDLQKRRE